jgi:hypothetical protein
MRLAWLILLVPLIAVAGSLGKYGGDGESQARQSIKVDEVEQRLNEKMAEAIKHINSLPQEQRIKLNGRYVDKLNRAVERGSYLEAAYYRGIIAGVEWGIEDE